VPVSFPLFCDIEISVNTAGVHATCSHQRDKKGCWLSNAGADAVPQGILGKSMGVTLDAETAFQAF